MPYKPGADPLKEPVRPQRDRKPVDRYSATFLAAQYCSAAGVGFTTDGTPRPDTLYVELDGMEERFSNMAQAFVDEAIGWNDTDGNNYTAQVREAFASLPIEAQRAACVMADHTVMANSARSHVASSSHGTRDIRRSDVRRSMRRYQPA